MKHNIDGATIYLIGLGIFIIGFLSFVITLWIMYGGKTIDEVPVWVLPFLFPGRH